MSLSCYSASLQRQFPPRSQSYWDREPATTCTKIAQARDRLQWCQQRHADTGQIQPGTHIDQSNAQPTGSFRQVNHKHCLSINCHDNYWHKLVLSHLLWSTNLVSSRSFHFRRPASFNALSITAESYSNCHFFHHFNMFKHAFKHGSSITYLLHMSHSTTHPPQLSQQHYSPLRPLPCSILTLLQ